MLSHAHEAPHSDFGTNCFGGGRELGTRQLKVHCSHHMWVSLLVSSKPEQARRARGLASVFDPRKVRAGLSAGKLGAASLLP